MGRRARPDAGAVSQGPPPPASARQGASGPALRWPRGPLSRGCRLRAASARWAVRQRFEPLSRLRPKGRSRGAGIKAPRVGRASDPPDGGASLTFFARSAGRAEPDQRPALPSRGITRTRTTKPQPWASARGERACALETGTALLPVGLGVVGLGVVLLARILRLFRRAARAAGLA